MIVNSYISVSLKAIMPTFVVAVAERQTLGATHCARSHLLCLSFRTMFHEAMDDTFK